MGVILALAVPFLAACPAPPLPAPPAKVYKVAITQIATPPDLDSNRQGIIDAMEEEGFVEGVNIDYIIRNAEGDMTVAASGQRQAVALVMATISKPALLLLDEHIANLDPRTAQIVLKLTEMIVQKEKMTTMMVTHNMELALRYGNRLIMMHEGRIVVDLNREQRAGLTINDLVTAFEQASGRRFIEDKILLRR